MDHTIELAMRTRQITRAAQTLMGLVTGMVADGELNDREIAFLNTWLRDNQEVAITWPGSAIARNLREILTDGYVSTDEREHLVKVLQELVGNDFVDTGSVSAAVAVLPLESCIGIQLNEMTLCLTGEFMYGTRPECERLSVKAGAKIASNVSKQIQYLVIGTRVSPNWINTSYGRKIEAALALKEKGHRLSIISERSWLDCIG